MDQTTDPRKAASHRFSLERFRFAIRKVYPFEFAEDPDVDLFDDREMGAIVLSIRQNVLASKPETVEILYPATWWEHFKERFFPDCLLDFCPIRYEVQTITAAELYPNIAMPPGTQYAYYFERKTDMEIQR